MKLGVLTATAILSLTGGTPSTRQQIDTLPSSGPYCVTSNAALNQTIVELGIAREIHVGWVTAITDGRMTPAQTEAGGDVAWHQSWVRIYDDALKRICRLALLQHVSPG